MVLTTTMIMVVVTIKQYLFKTMGLHLLHYHRMGLGYRKVHVDPAENQLFINNKLTITLKHVHVYIQQNMKQLLNMHCKKPQKKSKRPGPH